MNLKFLETFIWFAKLQNFKKTAEKLHATPPGIANRINTLEEQLGVELYVRGETPLRLTKQGRIALEYSERMLAQFSDMKRDIRLASRKDSLIRIGVIEVVTLSWLSDFVFLLDEKYPELNFEFVTGTTLSLLADLAEGELSLIFVGEALEQEEAYISEGICSYRMGWFQNGSFGDFSEPLNLADLAQLPILLPDMKYTLASLMRRHFDAGGIDIYAQSRSHIQLNCAFGAGSGMELVCKGLGVAFYPAPLLKELVKLGHLTEIPVVDKPGDFLVNGLYRRNPVLPLVPDLVALSRQAVRQWCDTSGIDEQSVGLLQ